MAEKEKYIEAVGRRKTSVARVRLYPAKKTTYSVNDGKLEEYFKTDTGQEMVRSALAAVAGAAYKVSAKVSGGGKTSQAEAMRLGITRALVKEDETRRKDLKALGFLKRDPRTKERKKFGLKKARRAPQWSKR